MCTFTHSSQTVIVKLLLVYLPGISQITTHLVGLKMIPIKKTIAAHHRNSTKNQRAD